MASLKQKIEVEAEKYRKRVIALWKNTIKDTGEMEKEFEVKVFENDGAFRVTIFFLPQTIILHYLSINQRYKGGRKFNRRTSKLRQSPLIYQAMIDEAFQLEEDLANLLANEIANQAQAIILGKAGSFRNIVIR